MTDHERPLLETFGAACAITAIVCLLTNAIAIAALTLALWFVVLMLLGFSDKGL